MEKLWRRFGNNMSRIGNAPIEIPAGVTVEKTEVFVMVMGPKGQLTVPMFKDIKVEIQSNKVIVSRKGENKRNKSLHGLVRSLINNVIIGVTAGWSKNLELVGVGFRAVINGNKLTLALGYSHPVDVVAPEGIQFEVKDSTKIKVSGIDKYLVGQVSANIRKVRQPDVYKGKGVRYEGEYIRKKAGKAGAAAGK